MSETLDVGLGDYRISPGDHVCALYSSAEERDSIMFPFMRSAVRSGDKCICVVDTMEPRKVLAELGKDDAIDPTACSASHQLDVVRAADTTLRSGRFSPPDMIGFWRTAVAGAMNSSRFQHVRAIGETSSSLRDVPGAGDVIQFESQLNELLVLYPQVIMCTYDLDYVGGSFLVDIISTHSKVFLKGALIDNPYYLTPDEWLERVQA
jgi:hypothetical protein